jgi:co-chaperonin GroES (HSP10)
MGYIKLNNIYFMKNVKAIGKFILVRPIKVGSGLIKLADDDKQGSLEPYGLVVGIGDEVTKVAEGDTVYFSQYQCPMIPDDESAKKDDFLFVFLEADILAIKCKEEK